MTDLPRVHPRERKVNQAKLRVQEAINNATQEYDLTMGELVAILSAELSIAAKYCVRYERHPDNPDKPGGIA